MISGHESLISPFVEPSHSVSSSCTDIQIMFFEVFKSTFSVSPDCLLKYNPFVVPINNPSQ